DNAWVGLAFAHYAAASKDSCFATVARDILQALKVSDQCTDALQGYTARFRPSPAKYRSTEHNTDMFALARILGDAGAQKRASDFVHGMYGHDHKYAHAYTTGTAGYTECDASTPPAEPVAADVQFLGLLADVDPAEDRKAAALAFALRPARFDGMLTHDRDLIGNGSDHADIGHTLEGLRFSSSGHGVQWETTASALMAMSLYKQRYGEEHHVGVKLGERIAAIRSSFLHLLDTYGAVPASVLGGNLEAWKTGDTHAHYPGGSDTGRVGQYSVQTIFVGCFFKQ
ncbi:unnamed protein product, partial [Polarella glacialis]